MGQKILTVPDFVGVYIVLDNVYLGRRLVTLLKSFLKFTIQI